MLKKGQDVLSFIKTDSKISNKEVQDLEYQINDVVYNRNMSYLAPTTASTLYTEFVEYGKQIASIQVTDKQKQHKEQVLTALRTNCQNLKKYASNTLEAEDNMLVKKVMKYTIYKYLEAKRNDTLTDYVIVQYLQTVKEIKDTLVLPLIDINPQSFETKELKNFNDLTTELLTILNKRYNESK